MNRSWKKPIAGHRWGIVRKLLAASLLTIGLIGCGGGGDDEPIIVGTGITIDGTISTNRTLASNSLAIKAKSGEKSTTKIGANGQHSAMNLEGSGPYPMRADLGNGDYLYSLGYPDANGVTTQNVNSYSDLLVNN